MSNLQTLHISKPRMPGKYDVVYARLELRDGYQAIAYDSDPYVEVTVLSNGEPLFTALVGNYRDAIPVIERNIEQYIAEVQNMG